MCPVPYLCNGAWLPGKLAGHSSGDVGAQQALGIHLIVHMHAYEICVPGAPCQLFDESRLPTVWEQATSPSIVRGLFQSV